MRFSTPDQVIKTMNEIVIREYAFSLLHGTDLNPFSTEGARNQWQRGFNNMGPRSFESTLDYDTIYQRGAAMSRLIKSKE